MAQIEKISTGFLSGNLFQETGYDEIASAGKYTVALIAALEAAYPESEIEVSWEQASGATPSTLQTHVLFADDEYDYREEERIKEDVERIMERIFEDDEAWVVAERIED